MRYLLIACALAALAVIAGCGSPSSQAERAIVDAAPRYIGPADRYDARVQGLTADSASQVQLFGYGVRPAMGLTLQTLTLTLNDVSYQRDPFRLTRVGTALFSLQVTDAAMTQYLNAQTPERTTVRNVSVTFLAGQMSLSGVAVAGGTEQPFSVAGALVPQGTLVRFQPFTTSDTPNALRLLLANLAVVDLSRLQFAPQVQTITLTPGVMTVSGTADPARVVQASGG